MAIVSGALQPGCLGPVPTPPCMQALRTIYLSQSSSDGHRDTEFSFRTPTNAFAIQRFLHCQWNHINFS